MKSNAIILFTRIPVPGETKTRLQPFLTMEECCRLQKAFIQDIHQVLGKVETACDIIISYTPKGNLEDLKTLLPKSCLFSPQKGRDIGEKMHNAILHSLEAGYKKCILIGSDIPMLKEAVLDEAFVMLDNSDIVLCPTEDGGYYLIGMKEPCEEVFRLEYGISTVFDKTLEAARAARKSCSVGECAMDIDEPCDLHRLRERLNETTNCPKTKTVLGELYRERETSSKSNLGFPIASTENSKGHGSL